MSLSPSPLKIALHGVPRSGTTWLGAVFDSHPVVRYRFQPLFSYAFKDYLSDRSSARDIDRFFKEIGKSTDDFILQKKGKEEGKIPDFVKTDPAIAVVYKEVRYHHILENLLTQDEEVKVVGLVRNPLSVLSSWLSAPREFRADLGWKIAEEWRTAPSKNAGRREEFNGFEKWKETTSLFENLEKKFSDRFYLLRYDDMIEDTETTVRAVFDFCELSVPRQTLDFITKTRQKTVPDTYSVYNSRRKDDKWKTALDPAIARTIVEDLGGTSAAKYLGE